jgi:GNAT superfamily N-acetyltransferase
MTGMKEIALRISGPLSRVAIVDVAPLLPQFELKYPGGWKWLDRRLADADGGETRLWLSIVGQQIAALAIEAPKGPRRSKLSTFVVGSRFRGRGVGSLLIEALQYDWLARDVEDVHVTIDRGDRPTQTFFARSGFTANPDVLIPYGEDRYDGLWNWSALNDRLVDAAAVH